MENPINPNLLRSVVAGKYVRYLNHENISGEPYSFPLSHSMKSLATSGNQVFRNDRVKNEFSLAKPAAGPLELIFAR
jgi:hypothetical protein